MKKFRLNEFGFDGFRRDSAGESSLNFRQKYRKRISKHRTGVIVGEMAGCREQKKALESCVACIVGKKEC